jgi:hypothetical protein
MPECSPEVDLLERLSGDDASLYEAAFGSCYRFRDLAHAKRVVAIYLKGKLVELYDSQAESKAAIPFHTARWLVQDDANWEQGTRYRLRLTEDGYEQFVEDSAGFFDRLFGQ